MPEQVLTPPVEEEEEKKPKVDEEEDEKDELNMDKHLSRIYKALGDMTEAVKELANFVKSSSEVQRGLEEAVKGLKSEVVELKKAVTIGFQSAASEHKKAEKFKTSGSPEAVGEVVNIPESQLREPGAAMLVEKGIQDIKKSVASVVSSPRPEGLRSDVNVGGDKVSDLVKGILSGKLKSGEVVRKLREVVSG
jgi:hypothetical protein